MKKPNLWQRFWGKKYRIYKNEEIVCEILVYHHKIYIKEVKYGQ